MSAQAEANKAQKDATTEIREVLTAARDVYGIANSHIVEKFNHALARLKEVEEVVAAADAYIKAGKARMDAPGRTRAIGDAYDKLHASLTSLHGGEQCDG